MTTTGLLLTLLTAAGGADCDAGPVYDDPVWTPLSTLELWGGYEGSKQPQDFGVNAHNGGRMHVNWAAPVWAEANVGLQIGTSLTLTDHAVRVTDQVDGSSDRTQWHTTVGLFQRLDSGWSWGAAYDVLAQDDYSFTVMSQVRGRVGKFVTARDEFGVLGNGPLRDDTATWGPLNVALDPIAMGAAFWRHTWSTGPETTLWLGVSEGAGRDNAALGDPGAVGERLLYGADVHIPLNDSVALFGEANFITPANAGTVDAYLGFAWYPGATAKRFRRQRYAPLLPVASNARMAIDGSRR